MFCIKCGKKAVIDNFCKECFLERNHLIKLKTKVVRLKICECGRYCIKEEWKNPKNMIENIIDDTIEIQENVEITDKQYKTKEFGNRIYITLTITGKIKGIEKTEIHEIEVIWKKNKCLICSRKSEN